MRTTEIKRRLMAVPLFKDLVHEDINHLVEISQPRHFKQKLFLFMQGEPLDRVFFLHSGKVKIYKTDSLGREQLISVLEAGEMFPHAGFFKKGNYPAHAEVIEDAQLITISIEQFEHLLLQHPSLCIKMFNVIGEKIVDLQNRLEEQILYNTYEQIIMLLLRLCKTNGMQQGENHLITTQFTNKELANMIGSSRETVNRTINQLKRNRLLQTDEDGRFIMNRELLKKEIL